MAYINCKKCGCQMSDKSEACPICGTPVDMGIENTPDLEKDIDNQSSEQSTEENETVSKETNIQPHIANVSEQQMNNKKPINKGLIISIAAVVAVALLVVFLVLRGHYKQQEAEKQREQALVEQQIAEQKRIEEQRLAEQKRIEEQRLAEQKRIEEQQEAIAFIEKFYQETWSYDNLERNLGPKVLKALTEDAFDAKYNVLSLLGLDPVGDYELLETTEAVATNDGRYEKVFVSAYWGDHSLTNRTRLIYTVEKNNGAFCISDIEWK